MLEVNFRGTLQDIGVGKHFMGKIPEAKATKEKVSKWDWTKSRGFCTSKETFNKVERQQKNNCKLYN